MSIFKKLLLCTAITVVFLAFFTGFALAETIGIGKVTGDDVNVREDPQIDAGSITQLAKGTEVKILDRAGKWYKISFGDGSQGWVFNDFISLKSVDGVIGTGVISGTQVNFRTSPDTSSDSIRALNKGEKVTVLKRSGEWYKVQTDNDITGWVHKSLVDARLVQGTSRGKTQERVQAPGDGKDSKSEEKSVKTENNGVSQDGAREKIAAYAKKFLGTEYVWGGTSPDGFDCSGFVSYVLGHFGVDLYRTSRTQVQEGKHVNKSELKPGDLVFFDTAGRNNGKINHVGIYIGDGRFIHSSSGQDKVSINDFNEGFYAGAYVTARNVLD